MGLNLLSFCCWQDEQLRTLVRQFGQQDWKFLASHFPVSAAPLRPLPQGQRFRLTRQCAWDRPAKEKERESLPSLTLV